MTLDYISVTNLLIYLKVTHEWTFLICYCDSTQASQRNLSISTRQESLWYFIQSPNSYNPNEFENLRIIVLTISSTHRILDEDYNEVSEGGVPITITRHLTNEYRIEKEIAETEFNAAFFLRDKYLFRSFSCHCTILWPVGIVGDICSTSIRPCLAATQSESNLPPVSVFKKTKVDFTPVKLLNRVSRLK